MNCIAETMCEIYKNLSLDDMEGEVWQDCIFMDFRKNIKDFTGLYKVSNMGRVKSLSRIANRKNSPIIVKEKIIKQGVCKKRGGYLVVCLFNMDRGYSIQVGVLVGKIFIPNPLNKRTVNHKKGDVKDNRVSELEWNTDGENNKHSYEVLGRIHSRVGKFGAKSPSAVKVICITTGQVFHCLKDAAKELNCQQSGITLVCQKKQESHKGYVFEYYTPRKQA